jgi:hypothetical protein
MDEPTRMSADAADEEASLERIEAESSHGG